MKDRKQKVDSKKENIKGGLWTNDKNSFNQKDSVRKLAKGRIYFRYDISKGYMYMNHHYVEI